MNHIKAMNLFTVSVNGSESPLTHQSFIASANLRTSILWSGSIMAVWDEAKASNKDAKNVTYSRSADKYVISLKKIGGQILKLEIRSIMMSESFPK